MPENDLWTQIPNTLLNAGTELTKSEAWAKEQKQKLADTWAQTQKTALQALQNEWQKTASQVSSPVSVQDNLLKLSPDTGSQPLPEKTFSEDTASSPNPADVLSNTPSDVFQPHMSSGTPESNFITAMREGAAHAGIYVSPSEGVVTNPNKEAALQMQVDQNKTRNYLTKVADSLPSVESVENTALSALRPGSALARGELSREATTDPSNPGSLIARGLLIATDAYGNHVPEYQQQLADAYTPTRPETTDPNATGDQRYKSQFSPEQLKAQQDLITQNVMGSVGGEDLVAEKGAEALAKAAGTTPILGGVFYSPAEKIINEKAPAKATGPQMLNTLINNGVKPVELAWTGLKDFLTGKQTITKPELQQFIKNNVVQIKEVSLGGGLNEDYLALQDSLDNLMQQRRDQLEQYARDKNMSAGAKNNLHYYLLDADRYRADMTGVPKEFRPITEEIQDAQSRLIAQKPPETKWEDVTLPGGKNYRELLLTMPEKDWFLNASDTARSNELSQKIIQGNGLTATEHQEYAALAEKSMQLRSEERRFQSSHWDEPNVLAHVRFDERKDPQGNPMLFLQEVQSDWAQQGRRQGFGNLTEIPPDVKFRTLQYGDTKRYVFDYDNYTSIRYWSEEDAKKAALEFVNEHRTPSMPFQRTEDWVKLAAKRMIAWAAEHGYQRIGWTTGMQQDAIEGLGGRFRELTYNPALENLEGLQTNGDRIQYSVAPEDLGNYVGTEIAQRLLNSPLVHDPTTGAGASVRHRLSGEDLKQPTKGMTEFYDKILPSVFKDLGKSFGAKLEDIPVGIRDPNKSPSEHIFYDAASRLWEVLSNYSQVVSTHTNYDEAKAALEALYPTTSVVHSIIIPPKMAQTAKAGQSLFTPPAVAGGVGGAVYGSQQGDTPQERAQNAIKYSLGGAFAGHVLGGSQLSIGMSVKPVHTDPALQKLADMLHAPAPEADFLSNGSWIDRTVRDYVRAMTDNGVDLSRLQDSVRQNLGRPLNANEMLAEQRRLNPNSAAQLNLQKNLAPALQQVGPQDQTALSEYLILRHNVEVAHAQGEKEFNRLVNLPLSKLPAQDQVRTLQARLTMYNRFLQQGIAASDGTVVTHYQPLVAQTQTYLQRAQKRLAQQTVAGKINQATTAQTAAAQVTADRKFSTGLTLDSSINALANLEQELGSQRFHNIEDAASKVTSFSRSLLQRKVDAGIITQDFANELNKAYPEYVPIRIMDHMIEPVATPGGGQKALSMGDTGIRELSQEGTSKLQEDPLAALVRLAYQTESVSMKNETFNALHNLITADPTNPAFLGSIKEVKPTAVSTRTLSIIKGYVNGVPTYYQMPRDLATAIQTQAVSSIPVLSQTMTLMRGLLASANPLFIPTHAMITAIPYMARTATREGGPQSLPRVVGALGAAYWDALFLPLLKGGLLRGRYGPNTEKYLQAGGGMFGNLFDYSPHAARASVEDLARSNALEIRGVQDIKRIALDLIKGKPFSEILNRVDLAPRVAAMNIAERSGANTTQAVTAGRTSTIDFAQGGNLAKQINQFIPFFNVAMQGTAVPLRMFRDNPLAAATTVASLLIAPTVGVEAWNRSDSQRAKDYQDVPNYYKDSGIVIMATTPATIDAQGNRKPSFFYIPMREFSPFIIATREIARRTMGENPRTWQSLLYGDNILTPQGGLLGSVSPIADAGRLLPGGPIGNMAVAGLTGVNPLTGSNVVSQSSNRRAGTVAHVTANIANQAKRAVGMQPDIQSSQVQYGLNELGGPGRAIGSVGQPQGTGSSLNPVVKNSIGQNLSDARYARMGPELTQLLQDAGMPEVTPASQVVSGIQLTTQEETELQNNLNDAFEKAAKVILANPRYQAATPQQKDAYLKVALGSLRTAVGRKFIGVLAQRNGTPAMRQRLKDTKNLPKAS